MKIVFTDLDECLLDLKYSFKHSIKALNLLRRKNIPLVICSAKTKAQIEYYRKILKIKDPFIVESGSAIFIPSDYFTFDFSYTKEENGYKVIEFGVEYSNIRMVFKRIKNAVGGKLIGYGDMSLDELRGVTGLSLEQAKLAKMRKYDEPFLTIGRERLDKVIEMMRKHNFNYYKLLGYLEDKEILKKTITLIEHYGFGYYRGGFFHHIIGKGCNKGKAAKVLIDIFKKEYEDLETIGLGNSKNDEPMLKVVDEAFLVQRANGTYDQNVKVKVKRVDSPGPIGWNKAIISVFK